MQNLDNLTLEIKRNFLENGVTPEIKIQAYSFIAQANKLLAEIEKQIDYQPTDPLAAPIILRNKIKAEKKNDGFDKLVESSNWLRKFEDV